MTVEEIAEALDLTEHNPAQTQARGAYTGDLLSDVMANAKEGDLLITIQAHKNTVAVCTVAGISAMIVCNSRRIPTEMLQAASENQIGVYSTPMTQFEVSGRIHRLLYGAELSTSK